MNRDGGDWPRKVRAGEGASSFLLLGEDDWFAIIRGRVDRESKWEEGEEHGEFVRSREIVVNGKWIRRDFSNLFFQELLF